MAASLEGILDESLRQKVLASNILVVGAGGIGCELLKNLVLTGFKNIETIDLDTIDVSNLNRQFLFRKEHVGKSKSQVAKESALKFNPDANITAYHDSVMNPVYGKDFFEKFDICMNALDNRAARNHVNRLCLAAKIPLIESGTAGYLGQVTFIMKGETECYECQPKPPQKTFPGCTIRNTPSEPIHCIVWAKHLFNQLFGESDPDEDVSPDTEDPELAADAGQAALDTEAKSNGVGGIERKSTRVWAQETGYDVKKIFNKLFRDDIKYLLSMSTLWKKRRPPVALDYDNLEDLEASSSHVGIRDQQLWTIGECKKYFAESINNLKSDLMKQGDGGMLVWDKDDEWAMTFVTAVANIRAHIFGIQMKTRFDCKSMAGNIIPAIATTNAVIAGMIVLQGIKILQGLQKECKTVYMSRCANPMKKILIPCSLIPPNPKCYVCANTPETTVRLNIDKFTVKMLEDKLMKSQFGMVAPDIEIEDGKGTVIVSSEEGETEDLADKFLSEFGIRNSTRLKCDDFLQDYTLIVNLLHADKLEDDAEFEVVGDTTDLGPKENKMDTEESNGKKDNDEVLEDDDDDDVLCVESDEEEIPEKSNVSRKRRADSIETPKAKKVKVDGADDVEEIVCLD